MAIGRARDGSGIGFSSRRGLTVKRKNASIAAKKLSSRAGSIRLLRHRRAVGDLRVPSAVRNATARNDVVNVSLADIGNLLARKIYRRAREGPYVTSLVFTYQTPMRRVLGLTKKYARLSSSAMMASRASHTCLQPTIIWRAQAKNIKVRGYSRSKIAKQLGLRLATQIQVYS
jgi:hypothetical protein